VSQRSLSRDLGIALGLTNLLIRRLVRRGWVRVIRIKPNRVRYLLTPAGLAEKARMSRNALQDSMRFYTEARDRISQRFDQLSTDCQGELEGNGQKRIVFFGAGEVAEIGYICLQGTDLRLVGVVDDKPRKARFFDLPVRDAGELRARDVGGVGFERLVVMSFGRLEEIREKLEAVGFPHERVFWI